ncbi:MAG: GHMP kinase [Kiritimatiellae bacterium]|nr:GHMP kinase [Kiritimatiellia bacterium]
MKQSVQVIRARSFARAGFLGNPSDGYYGKTLSFSFTEFCVDLRLTESSRLRFTPGEVDDASFDSPSQLVHDLRLYGYYGGIRMLKAVAKLFFEYCEDHGLEVPRANFTAEYKINIPRLVGLSGSSAICSAMLKALMEFYGVDIPIEEQPTLVMCAERDELGIACGLQDRVAQIYNGLTFMDFDRALVDSTGHGRYERLDPASLRNIYIAYDPRRAEESGRAHGKVLKLFQQQNCDVVSAMSEFADIAQRGRDALVAGRQDEIPGLVNANFDLRDRIFNVSDENRRMVTVARGAGASAKFAGSGGAIVGTYEDDAQFTALSKALAEIGCRTFKPVIASKADESADREYSAVWRNS